MAGILHLGYPGNHDLLAYGHVVGGHKRPRGALEVPRGRQHGQVVELVRAEDCRLERRAACQGVDPDRGTDPYVFQHVPGGDQQALSRLEAGAYGLATDA